MKFFVRQKRLHVSVIYADYIYQLMTARLQFFLATQTTSLYMQLMTAMRLQFFLVKTKAWKGDIRVAHLIYNYIICIIAPEISKGGNFRIKVCPAAREIREIYFLRSY